MNAHLHDYLNLIKAARDPQGIVTLALAGVMSMHANRKAPYSVTLYGLRDQDMFALLEQHFPGIKTPEDWIASGAKVHDDTDEFDDLLDLLLRHSTYYDESTLWLAHAIATASMAENHLWQDMGLPSRKVLSQLLSTYFTSLAKHNTGDMKWKKFFYKQLCDETGLKVCRAPSCGVCEDYSNCFGAEESVSIMHAVTM